MGSLNRKVVALEQYYQMRVVSVGGFFFEVVKLNSGQRYAVDLRKMTCTCPDHKERGVKCKHIRRVELEGYEGPIDGHDTPPPKGSESKTDWTPEDGPVWFDSRAATADRLRQSALCLVAPGKKKKYKFWVALADVKEGKVYLCWGDFYPFELNLKQQIGQRKEIFTRAPCAEARNRFQQKANKEYFVPEPELEDAIKDALVSRFASQGDPAPSGTEKPEKPQKTNWKSDNDGFVWF